MKHIKKELPFTYDNHLITNTLNENCIFFDIETTGFSPKTASLYLIGCLYKKESTIIVEQFFAETKEDEKYVLLHFADLLNHFETIFSFNGLGFDLPFIKTKCMTHEICKPINDIDCTDFFDKFKYIDIFKEITPLKPLLKLENYKQKTIENFLGIQREDKYSGGELISVYEEYIKTRDTHMEELLLLHNYEDVIGMLDLLPVLSYCKLLNGAYEIKDTEITNYTNYDGETRLEMIITLENKYTVPTRVSHHFKDFYLSINKDITKIRIPIFEGELKYFYPNPKDYFYLPVEDMAIHKSVASFVDKEYRKKAKACNCYTRKTSRFLPQYNEIITPVFKNTHKDKYSYFELSESFIASKELLSEYINHIFILSTQK